MIEVGDSQWDNRSGLGYFRGPVPELGYKYYVDMGLKWNGYELYCYRSLGMEDENGVKLMKEKAHDTTQGDAGPNIEKAEGPKGWHPDKEIMWKNKEIC